MPSSELTYGEYEPHFEQTLGLGAALLPHDHDVLAAHGNPYLHRDVHKDRACSVQVIDAIARARAANGPPSSSARVLALAAKDARGRTAAQDAILDLARYGVLDGKDLGRQVALLLTDDIVVGNGSVAAWPNVPELVTLQGCPFSTHCSRSSPYCQDDAMQEHFWSWPRPR